MFEQLFNPISINGLRLPNRLVRSATYDGAADSKGRVTDFQVSLFEQLALGGVGLIISGIASVHHSGRISAFQLDLADGSCLPGLKQLARSVHDQRRPLAVQLFHAGREGHAYQQYWKRIAPAPSELLSDPFWDLPHRALAEEELLEIIEAFGQAARRVREAGFDALQIHAAHAYLFSQFLSPQTNRRRDAWGGSLENRLRLHREVYQRVRSAVGEDFPVMIKLGVQDGFSGGLELDEGLLAAAACAEWGFDAIEVSQGLRGRTYQETEFRTQIKDPKKQGYFQNWSRAVKKRVPIPVIMVGGLRSPDRIELAIQRGDADLAALCRPLIREPDLVKRWQRGYRQSAACISCNHCYENVRKGPLGCVFRDGESVDR